MLIGPVPAEDKSAQRDTSQSLADRVDELIRQAKLDRKEALKLAAKERGITARGVVLAGYVATQRVNSIGRVLTAACIVKKRLVTVGHVFDACCIAKKRERSIGRVSDADGVA